MRKLLVLLCATVFVLGMVGSAGATLHTWESTTDLFEVSLGEHVAYSHNLTYVLDGSGIFGVDAEPIFDPTGGDTISSYTYLFMLYDYENETWLTVDDFTFSLDLSFTMDVTMGPFDGSLTGSFVTNQNGILDVEIQSYDSEFFVTGKLTAEGTQGSTNPSSRVPEPATMLLLGFGLTVMAVAGRKKMFKK